mmetsp:Transcript_3514/g.5233  ORF Transcript_3514/g.5233 Transcript_3514/m.5233 type:complete len:515 (+) Transcript_3514:76-1620(+)
MSSSHPRLHRHRVLPSCSEDESNLAANSMESSSSFGGRVTTSSHAAQQTVKSATTTAGTSTSSTTTAGTNGDAVFVLASSSLVPMDGTETDPVMTSPLVLRHQEESSALLHHSNNNSLAEEVVIEEDDAKSTNRAVSCAGEEDDQKEVVQELQSVEEESDYEYDYEDDEDGHFTGFLAPTEQQSGSTTATGANVIEDCPQRASDVSVDMLPEEDAEEEQQKSTWKEPSQAAVNMSLRAEREKCGGKRRLASDLYKIMMGDTSEQGFTMEPANEDSMDKWKIKLFGFDPDSNLQKDMALLGLDHIELEMSFPKDYPFAPPFVRVVRPRFKRQTGFVMNGALCMELLTNEGWNPVNDIESVIVSIRSLLVVGDGRLSAASHITGETDDAIVAVKDGSALGGAMRDAVKKQPADRVYADPHRERKIPREAHEVVVVGGGGKEDEEEDDEEDAHMNEEELPDLPASKKRSVSKMSSSSVAAVEVGSYTEAESKAAYSHLSDFHKKKGWDSTGWWARKG